MMASTIVFAAFSVFGTPIVAEFGSLTLNTFAFIAGAVILLPFTIWDASRYQLPLVSAAAWTGVLYMALFPSIAGYLIYSYALRYMPASRVSSVSYLQPVLATLFAIVFLRELPAVSFTVAIALVLGGVYFTQHR